MLNVKCKNEAETKLIKTSFRLIFAFYVFNLNSFSRFRT
jgi:hypothetical protein